MLKEEWKDIDNYEGLYQVSSLGRVRGLKRGSINKPFGTGKYRNYLAVSLSKDGKIKKYAVHRLVAMMFLNHKKKTDNLVIDHIDNNKSNNRLDNLQIITNRKNTSKDKINTSSKYTGVSYCKKRNRWIAMIYINGKNKNLGAFKTELEAHNKYQENLIEL